MVLAFFAASDGIISENLVTRFSDETDMSEAKAFTLFRIIWKLSIAKSYSLLIMNYITDPDEQSNLLNAVENYLY